MRLGYSVIEDYLKRGQQAAKGMAAGGLPFQSASTELQQLTERMFKYASDLASAWVDLLQAMTTTGLAQRQASEQSAQEGAQGARGRGGRRRRGGRERKASEEQDTATGNPTGSAKHNGFGKASAAANGAARPRRAPADEPRPLSLEIDASQPIEVMLDLRPVVAAVALEVTDLRAKEPSSAPLTGVTVTIAADPPRTIARVAVPRGQPPGLYTGLVLDAATNLPCGTLAVRVHAGTRAQPPLQ